MAEKPLTKTQLIAELSDEMQSDKKVAANVLLALEAIVLREIAAGGAVTLPGLGKFSCRDRPEREVRNPATGEMLAKPADRQVKMTIAKALKDSING